MRQGADTLHLIGKGEAEVARFSRSGSFPYADHMGVSTLYLAVRYSLTPGLIRVQHPAIIKR